MATIFRTASIWLKVAMLAMTVGLLLFLIGFATTSWMSRDLRNGRTKSYGLWKYSNYQGENEYPILDDFHRAIQAMECLGFIGFGVAFIIMLLYMVLDSCRRRDFLKGTTAATFAGVAFAAIGFILFTSNDEKNQARYSDVDWSMGLACTGVACYGLAGIMLIVQLIK